MGGTASRRPGEEDFDEVEEFDDAIEAWDERWDAVMFGPGRTVGAIVISHRGCALLREGPVISGVRAGTMWTDDRADEVDLAPLRHADGTAVTFARWYTGWPHHAERTVSEAARVLSGD
ncbi:hypothetical protein [Streptomyces zaomyceticus]|uniref:hypothetical protein n=1 Tax=Streptomyces zaomyceticus TaxID=68286 RepID=UPI003869D6D4